VAEGRRGKGTGDELVARVRDVRNRGAELSRRSSSPGSLLVPLRGPSCASAALCGGEEGQSGDVVEWERCERGMTPKSQHKQHTYDKHVTNTTGHYTQS
jgi:hypothetical protein